MSSGTEDSPPAGSAPPSPPPPSYSSPYQSPSAGGPPRWATYPQATASGTTTYSSSTERSRTITGITLSAIGFALSWIPYVDYVGGLLVLIGVIFLFLGRWGFDERHHNLVVVGGIFVLITFIGAIVAAAIFADALLAAAASSASPAQLGGSLIGAFDGLLFSGAVLGVIRALASVMLVYALVDRSTRGILWLAFSTQLIVQVVILVVVLPQVNSAIAQATSGSTVDLGPLNALTLTSTLWGLLAVIPSMLFFWAYLRARGAASAWGFAPWRDPRSGLPPAVYRRTN